jgi:septal ring factor EnvC (AmiA/AmiB activator)
MTDDLVKRLRDYLEHDEGKINDARAEAADRIEALERERDVSNELGRALEEDAGQLRERLAEAVKALRRIANSQPRPMRSGGYEGHDVSNMQRTARAALAEIEGEKT